MSGAATATPPVTGAGSMTSPISDVSHPAGAGSGARPPAAAPAQEVPFIRRPVVYVVGLLTGLALGLNWPVMALAVDVRPPLWLAAARLAGG